MLKNLFLKKLQTENRLSITQFCIFFFVLLLLIFINERPHTTLSVFDEGAIDYILEAKVWLYGFQSSFWQVLIDF